MVRPLTKRSKAGKLYERPPEIETNIEGALGQDLATLTRRAEERNRKSPHYLASECLVHLIRDAIRRGDQATYNALLPILFTRCEANLKSKIPSGVPYAEQLRDEVLGELGLLFAKDGEASSSAEMDFYECRFDKAFSVLRFSVLKREGRWSDRLVPLADGSPRPDEDEASHVEHTPTCRAAEHDNLVRDELLDTLPAEERKALVLCEMMGYDQTTAAKLCGVTDRTIRKRLAKAREHIERLTQGNT